MNFLLTVPFSTELNLSTFNAYRDEHNTVSHLRSMINDINNSDAKFDWLLNWRTNQDEESLYKSLDDSFVDNASKAILTLQINDLDRLKNTILDEVLATNIEVLDANIDGITKHDIGSKQAHKSQINASSIGISGCLVHFYDNTIGIMSMTIELDDSVSLCDVDVLSFDICSVALTKLRPLFDEIAMVFKQHPYFLKPEGDNKLFIAQCYKPYWINRTLGVNKSTFDAKYTSIEKWSKLYNNEHNEHNFIEYQVLFCIGNSIVISQDSMIPRSYCESINLATYFYCVYYNLNKRVSIIFEDIENAKVFETNFKMLYRIERLLLFVDNNCESIVYSLQSDSKKIVNNFFAIWDITKIRENLSDKTQKVYDLYKFERLKKSERLTKVVQAALAIIGASTLVDVMLNIILFSHESFEDKFRSYGVMDILSTINPDIILIVGFLILAWFAVMIARDIQKQ